MNDARLADRKLRQVPQGVGTVTPVTMAKAEGALIWDQDGREYIDFAGGIGVNNIGHRHPKVVAAIKEQADKYLHGCFHVSMYEPYVDLAEKLNALAPCRGEKMTMFANSGAEAVENAVKIARYATGRLGVVCFEGGLPRPHPADHGPHQQGDALQVQAGSRGPAGHLPGAIPLLLPLPLGPGAAVLRHALRGTVL